MSLGGLKDGFRDFGSKLDAYSRGVTADPQVKQAYADTKGLMHKRAA